MAKSDLKLKHLLNEIVQCQLCVNHLPFEPRPILRASGSAKLLIVGQAPGLKVHNTFIPWNDPSGVRLRQWLGLSPEQFYDSNQIAIIPMGFCYPGRGKSGDLPPRRECAEKWHHRLLELLPNIKLKLLIGAYAQRFYLPQRYPTLTETVFNWRDFLPNFFPLPHPSPRNQLWLKKNTWFQDQTIMALKEEIKRLGISCTCV